MTHFCISIFILLLFIHVFVHRSSSRDIPKKRINTSARYRHHTLGMLRISRRYNAHTAQRLLEYYKHRDWEMSLQKEQMRRSYRTVNNIPWSLIGISTAAILFFGIDLGIGVTQGGRMTKEAASYGIESKETTEEKKKKIAAELLEKRDVSISALKEHKEGNGPLAQRQARGEV